MADDDVILVDTGPLVALYRSDDEHHRRCVEVVRQIEVGRMLTCWPVLTEAAWLLRRHPAGLERLLSDVSAGTFVLDPLRDQAVSWIASFLKRYQDLPAQLADAALMFLAEQHRTSYVFTLDRRDFSIYRLSTGHALRLLPE